MKLATLRKKYGLVYLAPLLHLALCILLGILYLAAYLIPQLQPLLIGIEILYLLDFPISLLTMGIGMANHTVFALAWLFVGGTLWWYLLSLAVRLVHRNRTGRANGKP